MRHFKLLLLLVVSIFTATQTNAQDLRNTYEFTNFERFKESNSKYGPLATNEKRVVFMGNSITEVWPIARPHFFKNSNYIGRGISGQTTPQMLLRFRRDVINLNPKVVVLPEGNHGVQAVVAAGELHDDEHALFPLPALPVFIGALREPQRRQRRERGEAHAAYQQVSSSRVHRS